MINVKKKLGWFLENTNAAYLYRQQRIFKYQTLLLDGSASLGVSPELHCDREIVVSLTSFGHRVSSCYLTIVSLMYQTVRPNKIVLWLADDEFAGRQLPPQLVELQSRGLIVGYTSDLKSYKKIIPTLKAYPEAHVITVDDDVIYPVDFIERMVTAYGEEPHAVYFYRGSRISFDKRGRLLPYVKWGRPVNSDPQHNLPTGVGGVFYPAGCFHHDVTRDNLFMSLCPKADDLWLKVMCMLAGYGAICIAPFEPKHFESHFIEIEGTQQVALNKGNLAATGDNNDTQLRRLVAHYRLFQ